MPARTGKEFIDRRVSPQTYGLAVNSLKIQRITQKPRMQFDRLLPYMTFNTTMT